MARKLLLPFVLAGVIFLFGCSGMEPLSGTVTFSDDGSPLTVGSVFFETPTYSSRGTLGRDGQYVIGSLKETDGLPKGTYQISIRGAEDVVSTQRPNGEWTERRTLLIDPKYQNPETSGLTFTVDGKTKKFNIQVDRAR